MEFYSAMKENEILSFASKWMELENIISAKLTRLVKPKIVCSLSYADFRSKTKCSNIITLGSQAKGSTHTGEIGKGKKPKT
jgi:hypothetical protein